LIRISPDATFKSSARLYERGRGGGKREKRKGKKKGKGEKKSRSPLNRYLTKRRFFSKPKEERKEGSSATATTILRLGMGRFFQILGG